MKNKSTIKNLIKPNVLDRLQERVSESTWPMFWPVLMILLAMLISATTSTASAMPISMNPVPPYLQCRWALQYGSADPEVLPVEKNAEIIFYETRRYIMVSEKLNYSLEKDYSVSVLAKIYKKFPVWSDVYSTPQIAFTLKKGSKVVGFQTLSLQEVSNPQQFMAFKNQKNLIFKGTIYNVKYKNTNYQNAEYKSVDNKTLKSLNYDCNLVLKNPSQIRIPQINLDSSPKTVGRQCDPEVFTPIEIKHDDRLQETRRLLEGS